MSLKRFATSFIVGQPKRERLLSVYGTFWRNIWKKAVFSTVNKKTLLPQKKQIFFQILEWNSLLKLVGEQNWVLTFIDWPKWHGVNKMWHWLTEIALADQEIE